MSNAKLRAKKIKGMCAVSFGCMGKLAAIVRLDRLREVAKISDGPPDKVDGRVAALLFVSVDEPFSGCLIDHGILKEPFTVAAHIADNRDILYVHLPFDPQLSGRVVVP